jgi:hypothetical protein
MRAVRTLRSSLRFDAVIPGDDTYRMCQATVYLSQDGQEEEILRNLVLLQPVEDGLRLQAFFEEPVVVKAQVSRIRFLKHTVTLVSTEEA